MTQFILVIHVLSGIIALLSGFIALGINNRPADHKVAGRVFFNAMLSVFITAITLSVFKGLNFLLCIAVLSFYMTFKGVRAMRRLKGSNRSIVDFIALSALVLSGCYLMYAGLTIGVTKGSVVTLILFMSFGLGILLLSYISFRELIQLKSFDVQWLTVHQASMGGALIATVTAFSTTALSFLPALVVWLGPTIILSPLLTMVINNSNKTKGKTT